MSELFGILIIPISVLLHLFCCKNGFRKIADIWSYLSDFRSKFSWLCLIAIVAVFIVVISSECGKICQVAIGIISSVFVVLFVEGRNSYYITRQLDFGRIEYYRLLYEFVSHIKFSKGLELVPNGEDSVQTVWRILPFLIVGIRTICSEQKNLLSSKELKICHNIIRRYDAILMVIKTQELKKIKSNNIRKFDFDFELEDLAYRIAKDELGKGAFVEQYHIGKKILDAAQKIEYSLDGFDNWDAQAMAVLISSNCYGINEEMNQLFALAKKWPGMNKVING